MVAVSIAGKAQCGCVYHAEEGLPCPHDLALATKANVSLLQERSFTLHWKGGVLKPEVVKGMGESVEASLADAFSRAGYGHGALKALDFWVQNSPHVFSTKLKSVVGQARCGCVYHAEEGIPCSHDIDLAVHEGLHTLACLTTFWDTSDPACFCHILTTGGDK
jgi:hypothetical protein